MTFLFLLLLPFLVDAGPWRASNPIGGPRLPLFVANDFNSRSISSLSSSIPTFHGGASRKYSPRGGSTMPSDGEDEAIIQQVEEMEDLGSEKEVSVAENVTTAASSVASTTEVIHKDNDNNTQLEKAHHSHVSKKRRRRKKEKLDGPHAMYAKKLKNRNHTNIRRKVMHACFGLGFGCLNYFIPRSKFVPGMTVLTSATLLMELLRYRRGFGWMNDALHWVLGASLRKHEMEGKFTGSFYFFFGVTVTAALYPKTCATMGMWQLALADPSASYFGRQTRHVYWSRIENGLWGFGRNKGVLGFLGGALFCFPFNYRVLSIAKFGRVNGIPGGQSALILSSLALGLAGAFADLAVPTPALTMPKKVFGVPVPPFHVDDNFVVPIVSGFACTKVFSYLGWPGDLRLAKYILF